MTNLGIYKAGETVFYAGNYHDSGGALADPSNPLAQLRAPDGSWSNMAAPSKQNGKTGHFGGTIDTTGLAEGQYAVRLEGTVGANAVAAELYFQLSSPYLFDPASEILDSGDSRSFTYKEAMRLVFAFLLGERAGGGYSGDKTFKLPGSQKTRVTLKTDSAGNSTAAHILDPSDA